MLSPGSHTSSQEQIGIVYFHRSLEDEYTQKAELTNQNWPKFKALYNSLEKRLKQTLNQVDLPIFEVSGDQQIGVSFGDRLAHAISSAFDQGLDHVIVVGNDCPQLNPRILRKARTELLSGRAVIGPDHQGGAYLIGINRNEFDQEKFATLPWQQPQLLKALKAHFSNPTFLDRYQDLNTRTDLLIFVPKALGILKSILHAIFGDSHHYIYFLHEGYLSILYCYHLRPPPEIRHSSLV